MLIQRLFSLLILQSTQAQCGVIGTAYIELLSADAQSEDRYCGAYLAQSTDTANGAKSSGVVYGKHEIHQTNVVL